jgi:hypothetical protein
VRGPDNQQLFCVYHGWYRRSGTNDERELAIDRLEWAGERMHVIGANSWSQPAPNLPTFADYFDLEHDHGLGSCWTCNSGRWQTRDGMAWQQQEDGEAEASFKAGVPYFIAEVSLRMKKRPINGGGAGIKLNGEQGALLFFTLIPDAGQAVLTLQAGGHWRHQDLLLPDGFDFTAFHQLRIEVNARLVRIIVDDVVLKWEGILNSQPCGIALMTQNKPAEFAGFSLTKGWEDLFTAGPIDPAILNWRTTANDDRWRIDSQHLWYVGPRGESSVLTKGPLPEEYELVINARLISDPKQGICYGFLPALTPDGKSPLLTVERRISGWAVCCQSVKGNEVYPLPPDFDPSVHQQFRFRRRGTSLTIQHEAQILGEIESPAAVTMVGLYGYRAVATFDMVRVTALSP